MSKIKYLPIQMGDIVSTHASIKEFTNITSYQPSAGIKDGTKAILLNGIVNITN